MNAGDKQKTSIQPLLYLTMACEKQDELRRTAMEILKRIDALTEVQIQAMRDRDDEKLMEADKQLEVLFGEKQRTYGALFDHRNEHGC